MKEFSYKTMALKGLKYFVLFLLPVLVNMFIVKFPELAQLTVGALLVMLVNFLKVKVGTKVWLTRTLVF